MARRAHDGAARQVKRSSLASRSVTRGNAAHLEPKVIVKPSGFVHVDGEASPPDRRLGHHSAPRGLTCIGPASDSGQ